MWVISVKWQDDWWCRIRKEVSWPNRGILPEFAWRRERPRPTIVMIAGAAAKIRTEYLTNKSPERYCYARPFGYLRCYICSCYLKSLRKHTAISGLNDAACWLFSSLLSCLDLINWILYVSPHTWILPACNMMPYPILISDRRGGKSTPLLTSLLHVPQREIEYWLGDDRDCWLIIFKSGVASIVYCVPLTSLAPRSFTTFIYCLIIFSGKKVICYRIFRIRLQRRHLMRCVQFPKDNARPCLLSISREPLLGIERRESHGAVGCAWGTAHITASMKLRSVGMRPLVVW